LSLAIDNRSSHQKYSRHTEGSCSTDLHVSEPLRLQLAQCGHTRRHPLDEGFGASLALVDLVAREGDPAQEDLDAELGETAVALEQARLDSFARPRRAIETVEERLDARPVRHDHDLRLERVIAVDGEMVVDVGDHLCDAALVAEVAMIDAGDIGLFLQRA